MYALPFVLPGVPVRRPSIESSAKIEMRVRRSPGVIAAVVAARGAGGATVEVEPPQAAASRTVRLAAGRRWRMEPRSE
jgi:hypothetical protein